MFVTYLDLLEHVARYIGKDVSPTGVANCAASAQAAIREIQGHHDWSYFRHAGRLVTVEKYDTGTVEYDHTGGTYERMLTLTDGTWPTWVEYGFVIIANVHYEVDERKSATVVTLTEETNPGADVAAETSYSAGRDTYPMPTDFQAMGNLILVSDRRTLEYVHPQEMMASSRDSIGPGRPTHFTIIGGQARDGKMAIKFWPYPDTIHQFDFDYRRRPRAATVSNANKGLVTVTAASTAITGQGTSFTSKHVGAILRLGYDSKDLPTGPSGVNPFHSEVRIKSVTSATAAVAESAFTDSLAKVTYVISDPVDIEPGAMETALYRLAERNARQNIRMETIGGEVTTLKDAMAAARDADSRYYGERGPGRYSYPRRLSDYPQGPDEVFN